MNKAGIGWTLGGLLLVGSGCGSGGGGGGGPSGIFLDSPVSGLTATSGTKVGTTDANGRFAYLAGAQVMFALGDIVVGLGLGEPVMTPVDLVPGAVDETDDEVTNIARFLQTLDLDQDPDNGIEIDASIAMAAVGVTLDFSTDVATFETLAQPVVDMLTAGLPGGARPLVAVQQAQDHLRGTLRSIVAGRYEGRFDGDDSGPFTVFVDRDGELFGWAYSQFDGLIALQGDADVDGGFLAGNASTGATFSGQIESDGTLAGTWALSPESGTFDGRRVVSVATALDEDLIDMLAGTYVGTSTGSGGTDPLTVLVDDDGNLTQPPPDDNIAGTVIATGATSADFSGVDDEGTVFRGTIDVNGNLSGTYRNDLESDSGSFTATRQ